MLNRVSIIRAAKEVDHGVCKQIVRRMEEAVGKADVYVDFYDTVWVDSKAIGLLLGKKRKLAVGTVHLVRVSTNVAWLFEHVGITLFYNVCELGKCTLPPGIERQLSGEMQ